MTRLRELFRRPPVAHGDSTRPWVVLDVELDRGAVSLVLVNIGAEPAYDVRVEFDAKRRVPIETRGLHEIRLFRGLSLLRPDLPLRVWLDTANEVLGDDADLVFTGVVRYRDHAGCGREEPFNHDLAIFRDWPARV